MQLVRECKEVLKGGLLMKQYYQFMLHEVLLDRDKVDCNMDAFQEDLHKMLMVGPPYPSTHSDTASVVSKVVATAEKSHRGLVASSLTD